MSMIIIMKSNTVNLSFLFMFVSKDHRFCKKVQLKQAKAEVSHSTDAVPADALLTGFGIYSFQ